VVAASFLLYRGKRCHVVGPGGSVGVAFCGRYTELPDHGLRRFTPSDDGNRVSARWELVGYGTDMKELTGK
jgi:hypothetical protein